MAIKMSNSALSCTYTKYGTTFYEAFKVLTTTLKNNRKSEGLLSNYEIAPESEVDKLSIIFNKEFRIFKIEVVLNNISHKNQTIIKIQAIGDFKLILKLRFFVYGFVYFFLVLISIIEKSTFILVFLLSGTSLGILVLELIYQLMMKRRFLIVKEDLERVINLIKIHEMRK